jgi:hypothetical protein
MSEFLKFECILPCGCKFTNDDVDHMPDIIFCKDHTAAPLIPRCEEVVEAYINLLLAVRLRERREWIDKGDDLLYFDDTTGWKEKEVAARALLTELKAARGNND